MNELAKYKRSSLFVPGVSDEEKKSFITLAHEDQEVDNILRVNMVIMHRIIGLHTFNNF